MIGPRLSALLGGALILLAGAAAPAGRTLTVLETPAPRGPDYVAWVSAPPDQARPKATVYILDGGSHLGAILNWISGLDTASAAHDAVFVMIGYDTDSQAVIERRRVEDFTSPLDPDSIPDRLRAMGAAPGGLQAFLSLFHTEIERRVAALTSVDDSCQILAGHSLGGLAVLHDYLDPSSDVDRFVAVSPSIWWNGAEILRRQPPQRPDRPHRLRLYVGALEQPATPDRFQMVENARAFANAVARAGSADTVLEILPGADHDQAAMRGFQRGLEAALEDCRAGPGPGFRGAARNPAFSGDAEPFDR